MLERKSFNRLRNFAAVSVMLPAAAFGSANQGSVNNEIYHDSPLLSRTEVVKQLPSLERKADTGLFGDLDSYLETNYGKALASAAVIGSLSLLWSSRKISMETDSNDQEKLAFFSSAILVSFASILLTESIVDIDPKVTASLFEAFVVTQASLNLWRTAQRHRDISKRAPAVAVAISLVTLSSIPLVESIK